MMIQKIIVLVCVCIGANVQCGIFFDETVITTMHDLIAHAHNTNSKFRPLPRPHLRVNEHGARSGEKAE